MPVSATIPDDVQILYQSLKACTEQQYNDELRLNIANCGTAARFLTAFLAQREGKIVILDGIERMRHRPIGQLVEALREIGAQIEYLGEEGFLPLRIKGYALDKNRIVTINNPQSTQFVSALLLIGANVQTNSTSPYIYITRALVAEYAHCSSPFVIEKDWSSAAFWYEYVALYGGELELEGLYHASLQGDKVAADIYAQLGVETEFTPNSIILRQTETTPTSPITIDFTNSPDLYPALALTCERMGIELIANGVDSLPWKESDRLNAVKKHRTEHDHRMAMALMVAGYEVDDIACISKSYPQFMDEYHKVQTYYSHNK